eukprot:3500888-Pyramimonas_sp.AAC.2
MCLCLVTTTYTGQTAPTYRRNATSGWGWGGALQGGGLLQWSFGGGEGQKGHLELEAQNEAEGRQLSVPNTTGQCVYAGTYVGAHRGPEELSRTPEPLASSTDYDARLQRKWNYAEE